MSKRILYFGYGANAHADMMEAITGRRPEGFRARLEDYGLFLQDWGEIPPDAKKILEKVWDNNFKSYIAVPLSGGVCHGFAWGITRLERRLVGEWELHNIWYRPVNVKIKNEVGSVFHAETEIIPSTSGEVIIGEDYNSFPNNKQAMLDLAIKVRREFLQSSGVVED